MAGLTLAERKARAEDREKLERENRSCIYYRPHDGDHYRVWRPFWYGDQFEVMLIADFEAGRNLLQRLGFRIIKVEGDD